MHIRVIRPEELDRFTAFHLAPAANADIRTYLTRQLDTRYMRPEWCFVAVEGEQFLGMVAYWGPVASVLPTSIALFDLPWGQDDVAIGERLLSETLALFAAQGLPYVDYSLREPSSWHRFPERQRAVLEQLGFRLMREAKRYEWLPARGRPPRLPKLAYRSIDEVGEHAFVEAIARVSEGTLDRWIAAERAELGAEVAARAYFQESQGLRYEPGWWLLGYTADGQLAGLIMMAFNNAGPIVDYIGVVPEQRGQGLVHDLLAQGLQVIERAEALAVRADADTTNWPMQQALERAGFERRATHWDYQRWLNPQIQA